MKKRAFFTLLFLFSFVLVESAFSINPAINQEVGGATGQQSGVDLEKEDKRDTKKRKRQTAEATTESKIKRQKNEQIDEEGAASKQFNIDAIKKLECNDFVDVYWALEMYVFGNNTTVLHAFIKFIDYDISGFLNFYSDSLKKYHNYDSKWIDMYCRSSKTTPLLYAVINNRIEAAKELMEHGADVNVLDAKGRSIWNIAIENKEMLDAIGDFKNKDEFKRSSCTLS